MLDISTAKRIGLEFCVNALGLDFVDAHKSTATFAYGEMNGALFCFVGVGDAPCGAMKNTPLLDSASKFPYRASCVVAIDTGNVTPYECVKPR